MILSKNSFLFILLFLSSCSSTSFYRVYDQEDGRAEIIVSSDRIISECIDLEDPPSTKTKAGKFLFYFHVLDSKNHVINIGRDNIHEKEGCFEYKAKVDKIIARSKQIYIGGKVDLDDPQKLEEEKYTFKHHGTFRATDLNFEFALMKGDNGECFQIFEGEGCSTLEHPLKKLPF
jgi:hypothetical protein